MQHSCSFPASSSASTSRGVQPVPSSSRRPLPVSQRSLLRRKSYNNIDSLSFASKVNSRSQRLFVSFSLGSTSHTRSASILSVDPRPGGTLIDSAHPLGSQPPIIDIDIELPLDPKHSAFAQRQKNGTEIESTDPKAKARPDSPPVGVNPPSVGVNPPPGVANPLPGSVVACSVERGRRSRLSTVKNKNRNNKNRDEGLSGSEPSNSDTTISDDVSSTSPPPPLPPRWEGGKGVGRDPLDELVSAVQGVCGAGVKVSTVLSGMELSNRQFTTFLKKLSKRRASHECMWHVFQWGLEEMEMNVIHYNAFINSVGRASVPQALEVYAEMRNASVPPDVYTFNSLIAACARKGQCQQALTMYHQMKALCVQPDQCTFNTLMLAYEKSKDFRGVLALQSEMLSCQVAADVVTYSMLISASQKVEKWNTTLRLYQEMQGAGVKPNQYTFSLLISGCSRRHRWRGQGRSESMYGASQLAEAMKLYDTMLLNNVRPNIVIFSALITAAGEGREVERAIQLFQEMKRMPGIKPNAYIYNALISACERGGRWREALQVWNEMRDDPGVIPDIVTATTVLQACKTGLTQTQRSKRRAALLSRSLSRTNEAAAQGYNYHNTNSDNSYNSHRPAPMLAEAVMRQEPSIATRDGGLRSSLPRMATVMRDAEQILDRDDLDKQVEELLQLATTIGDWPANLIVG